MSFAIINVDCLIRLKQSRIERLWPAILERLARSLLLDELAKGNRWERPCGPDGRLRMGVISSSRSLEARHSG